MPPLPAVTANRVRMQTPASLPERTLKVVDDRKIPVESASGVVALGKGELLVVDDDRGIFRVKDDKASLLWGKHDRNPLGDLEAVTADRERGVGYAVAEVTGFVYRFPVDGSAKPEKLGALPHISKEVSHNWEALAFLPASLAWDKKDHLVAGHQGTPRRFVVLSVPDLAVEQEIKLDHAAKALLGDIADLAVQPGTGHFFALSDDSRRLVEMRLDADGFHALSSAAVPVKVKDHPEGVGFDGKNRVVIVCDGTSRMITADLH